MAFCFRFLQSSNYYRESRRRRFTKEWAAKITLDYMVFSEYSRGNFLRVLEQLLLYKLARFDSHCSLTLSLSLCLSLFAVFRTGIITFARVSCSQTAAHWSWVARPALWPFGTWPLRRRASRLNWPHQPQPATLWLSALTPRSASPAAATEISPCGTYTTRPLSGVCVCVS